MSSPSSAMSTWAALAPMPGTSSRRCSADSGVGLGVGVRGWSVSWVPVVAAAVPAPEAPAPSLAAGRRGWRRSAPGCGWSAGRSGCRARRCGPAASSPARHGGHRSGRSAPPPAQRACRASAPGQLGQHLGVTLPGHQRLQHGPPGDPMMSVATVPSLIRASTRQPAPAAAPAGRRSGRTAAGCSPATGGSRPVGQTRVAACPAG
jgi:hypothetical protein